MIQTLYLEGEVHALLVAGLEDFQTRNVYMYVHIICTPARREECPDTFGHELHLCLCCQYTWQWPRVTQSFHPSGPSTPRWVNYLTAEPGVMQKPAELDEKFQPTFLIAQSRSQMFHGWLQHPARFTVASLESTPALKYNKVGLRAWDVPLEYESGMT